MALDHTWAVRALSRMAKKTSENNIPEYDPLKPSKGKYTMSPGPTW